MAPKSKIAPKSKAAPKSKTAQAVFWIMQGKAVGEVRSQVAASKRFGVAQANISVAMRKMVHEDIRPDARRKDARVQKGG